MEWRGLCGLLRIAGAGRETFRHPDIRLLTLDYARDVARVALFSGTRIRF
jgi:hypothetical protein